jgi:transglutaminase-like putative cysteine protease
MKRAVDRLQGADGQTLTLLASALVLAVLPHVFHLNVVVLGFFGGLLVWRLASIRHPGRLPGRTSRALLTLIGGGLVLLLYHRFYGREAGSSLLIVGLGLKLMEMQSRRDIYLIVYLAFFVTVTQYLFSQSIVLAAYTLVVAALLIAVLISMNCGAAFLPAARLRLAGSLIAQAVPIMIVLFIFFPRITGPLWKLPDEGQQASSGLSDTMEPGSISRLALSEAIAFRVNFVGNPPPPNDRYWRGPVFWHTDGRRWRAAAESFLPAQPVAFSGQPYRYTIVLEPHSQKWVFALDLPANFPEGIALSAEFQLLAKDKISDRKQFALVSYPDYHTGALSERERRLGLQLPAPASERIVTLLSDWKKRVSSPDRLIGEALRFFHDEAFVYTLDPPTTGEKPIETFLFETRKGFCEHYATSFVYLMRAAGIPARVVTGYQGGQWNPVGRFLEIRQTDAHAWAEVWLPDNGWMRVDPTAAVAPERIVRGFDLERQMEAGRAVFNPFRGLAKDAHFLAGTLRQARLVWASVDHAWHVRVLSYDAENQNRFLSPLGGVDWKALLFWLTVSLTLIAVLTSLFILRRKRPPADPTVRAYARFCRKLARKGLPKNPGEGALDFSRRARAAFPDAGKGIEDITDKYLSARYGPTPNEEDVRQLERRVRAFRI